MSVCFCYLVRWSNRHSTLLPEVSKTLDKIYKTMLLKTLNIRRWRTVILECTRYKKAWDLLLLRSAWRNFQATRKGGWTQAELCSGAEPMKQGGLQGGENGQSSIFHKLPENNFQLFPQAQFNINTKTEQGYYKKSKLQTIPLLNMYAKTLSKTLQNEPRDIKITRHDQVEFILEKWKVKCEVGEQWMGRG